MVGTYEKKTLVHRSASSSIHIYEVTAIKRGRIRLKSQGFPTSTARNTVYLNSGLQKLLLHPYISRVFHRYIGQSVLHYLEIESEWPGDSLSSLSILKTYTNQQWNEDEIVLMLSNIVEAMSFAQKLGVSHGNITPETVFFRENPDYLYQITDFYGCLKEIEDFSGANPVYFSPERRSVYYSAVSGEEITDVRVNPYKSDVYSLGLVALFMIDPRSEVQFSSKPSVSLLISSMSVSPGLQSVLHSMLQESEDARCDFVALDQSVRDLKSTCYMAMANKCYQEGMLEYALWYLDKVGRTVNVTATLGTTASIGSSMKRRLIARKQVDTTTSIDQCRVCQCSFSPDSDWVETMHSLPDNAHICSHQCYLKLCVVCHSYSDQYFYLHCRKHIVCDAHYAHDRKKPSLFAICPQCTPPKVTKETIKEFELMRNDCDSGVAFFTGKVEEAGRLVNVVHHFSDEVFTALRNDQCHFCSNGLTNGWILFAHGDQATFVCSKECEGILTVLETRAETDYVKCPTCQNPMLLPSLQSCMSSTSINRLVLPHRREGCSYCSLQVTYLALRCHHGFCKKCMQQYYLRTAGSEFPCMVCGRAQAKSEFAYLLESSERQ